MPPGLLPFGRRAPNSRHALPPEVVRPPRSGRTMCARLQLARRAGGGLPQMGVVHMSSAISRRAFLGVSGLAALALAGSAAGCSSGGGSSGSATGSSSATVVEVDASSWSSNEELITDGDYRYVVRHGYAVIVGDDHSTIMPGYTGPGGDVSIPSTLGGYPVRGIGGCAFWDCANLASVKIPDSVTKIGGGAFCDCTSLVSVDIPDSVTWIDDMVFENCTSLASVDIPDSVTYIGAWTFEGCTSLADVDLSTSLVTIGLKLFYGCSSLSSVAIPSSVTSIGYQTFDGCTSLASIVIPGSVTSIREDAFTGCPVTLTVERGSYAAQWAADNGVDFVYSD